MKTFAFIVCGYGVPKDINDDFNYQMYLRLVVNHIYDILVEYPESKAIIIPTGGPTDMRKPYKRTEAGLIADFIIDRFTIPGLKPFKSRIKILPETKALSTVENILYSKRILDKKNRGPADVSIFCEKTRAKKVEIFGKEVFGKKPRVIAIDFDQSANRYLDPKFIAKKEAVDTKYGLMALRSPDKLKKYRAIVEEKFRILREAGPENHVQAVRAYWEQALKELEQ